MCQLQYKKCNTHSLHLYFLPCSVQLDVNDRAKLVEVVKSCVGTKFIGRWADMACSIALDAVKTVALEENGRKEIDIKRYAKVEKIPGGSMEDCTVLSGVMVNKDVTHPKMKRYIEKPRIVLLDCSLEYKKGESQTNIEIMKEEDFTRILQLEEEYIQKICADIIAVKPDVVFTEKGISDLAQHFLLKVIFLFSSCTSVLQYLMAKVINNLCSFFRLASLLSGEFVSQITTVLLVHAVLQL